MSNKILISESQFERLSNRLLSESMTTRQIKDNRSLFFKIVKMIVDNFDFEQLEGLEYDFDDRADSLQTITRLLGMDKYDLDFGEPEGLGNLLYHTSVDNYQDIKDGSIQDYDDLIVPALINRTIPIKTNVTKDVDIKHEVDIDSYSESDAINSIYRDDYGDYLYYNYEYEEDVNDESINDIEVG